MRFYIEHHSSTPYHAQISDQIKVALLVGWIRPGDMLPSIRDLERETGISRNIIRRAYVELEQKGILKLTHGKGVRVVADLKYPSDSGYVKRCVKLCGETLVRGQRLGLLGSSFARLLYQMALQEECLAQCLYYVDMIPSLAEERAQQLSSSWMVTIKGITVEDVPGILPAPNGKKVKIFTNHYRYGEVSSIVAGRDAEVTALRLKFSQAMINRMNHLPKAASVMVLMSERDFSWYGGVILSEYEENFPKWINFQVMAVKDMQDLNRQAKSGKYNLVLVSNRLWESAPPEIKKNPLFARPRLEIDVRSAEEARITAGVLI